MLKFFFTNICRFQSKHEEDKRNALLSYNLIDKKQFFQVPPNLTYIEAAVNALQTTNESKWPCSREEELRWKRESSIQEATLPIYKCGPSQDLSCSLMLTISPWCLFINSTGCTIRLRNRAEKESCIVEPNGVIMPFQVEVRNFFVCLVFFHKT